MLANKCDLLDNIDQQIVVQLEDDLENQYPHVMYREISVLFNIDVQRSMNDLADALHRAKPLFAKARLEQILQRTGSKGFMILDPEQ